MNELPKLEWYAVSRLIAEGGTARVYWGVDLRTGFPVAIKELKIRHLSNPVLREKFKNMETHLYMYLEHDNIPKLVDFIDMKKTGQLFLVMEFIEGRTLDDYIAEDIGLIPEERALPTFLDLLDVVGYLHGHGILHLDIKTGNIMLQYGGGLKLIDLGIASRINGAKSTGYGTPAYMPPEQYELGEAVGRYTDIFALGVVLYEMLTGHVPFSSDSPDPRLAVSEIRTKIKFEPVPAMQSYYPFINDDLQFIVERALQKNPSSRYSSCDEFAAFIREYMDCKQNVKWQKIILKS